MILPLDSIIESKCKCKSNNEAKKNCKVMTLGEKIKIPDMLHCGMSTAAFGLTFCSYFTFKSDFPLIFYFNA
jgi:hypothetical protein